MNGTECLLRIGSDDLSVVGTVHLDEVSKLPMLTYSDEWRARGFPLAPSLPFTATPADAFSHFLENLIPEEPHRNRICNALHISRGNLLGLALSMGNDLTGALILESIPPAGAKEKTFRPISEDELLLRLTDPDNHPMEIWDRRPRLSVAGVQTKLNVLKIGSQYGLTEGTDLSSDRILKFDDIRDNRFLVMNEFISMQLARACGLPVADVSFMNIGGRRALEVLRFDRKFDEQQKRTDRKYMIDACQALGVISTYKYEHHLGNTGDEMCWRQGVTFKKLYSLKSHAFNPPAYLRSLFTWMIFNLLIGNSDSHGKNISFFVSRSGITMTPWYDLLSVRLIPNVSHELALSVGDEFDPAAIHALQLLYEADDAGIPNAKKLIGNILERILGVLEKGTSAVALPDDLSDGEKALVERYDRFLSGQVRYWKKEARILPKLTVY